ncbi:Mlc2p PWA37_004468 [Arxiozyma heterogenica]|uniref:EF-hand domain-containing protein n=1 Tax=Arxiozyma heterogenica TaxID=278026 RepID=A0AAN7ZT38_9SACH|nr:hypothetical protein RI543_000756 [Kazachstania heterogenica]
MEHSQSITFNQLNQEYISRLRDAFQMFDDDGDGMINESDLIKSLQSVGKIIESNDPVLNKMLSGKEAITFAEFLNVMSQQSGEFDEKELEQSLLQLSSTSTIESNEKTNAKYEIQEGDLIKLIEQNGIEDIHEFDKIFQTFIRKGVFNGKQFLDTISEK